MPRAARTVDTTKAVNIAGTKGVTRHASSKPNAVATGRLTTLSTGKSRGATHQRGNSVKRYSGSGRKGRSQSSGRKTSSGGSSRSSSSGSFGRRKGRRSRGASQCCCLLYLIFKLLFTKCYECCKKCSTKDDDNNQNNVIVTPMVNPNPMVSPVVNPNQENAPLDPNVPVSEPIIVEQPVMIQPQNEINQPMMQPMNEQPISNQNNFQPQSDIGFTNNQGVAQIYTN